MTHLVLLPFKSLKNVFQLFFFSGTIVLDNPAAQPADVLLMSATPHRRARSAAWSYHFYAEEKSVDLKILLPCAVLLKEVHLQPHHMSLASEINNKLFGFNLINISL